MCRRSRAICWYILLFVASSDSRGSVENNDEQGVGMTARRDLHTDKAQSDTDELIEHNSREKSTKSYDNVQHEFRVYLTKDDGNDDDDSMRYDLHERIMMNDEESNRTEPDSTKANNENNFSQRIYENFTESEGKNDYGMDDKNNTLSNETCSNGTCVQLCCPRNYRLIQEECVSGSNDYTFPDVYRSNDLSRSEDKGFDEIFQLIARDPCEGNKHVLIHSDEYVMYSNGSIYLWSYDTPVPPTKYCLAVGNRDAYDLYFCKGYYPIFISIGVVISLPFLLATFVVYSILPELQNMHGYTLRGHVISLFVTYSILAVLQQISLFNIGFPTCIAIGTAYSLIKQQCSLSVTLI